MSLITEALKKAQSGKLARRYLSSEPSGVLPVAREGQGAGWSVSPASILDRIQPSATLWVGLGSGIALFVVLFAYFFYGGGTKGIKGTKRIEFAMNRKPAELIVEAPPTVSVVEPPVSVGEGSLADKSPGSMAKRGALILPGRRGQELTGSTVKTDKTGFESSTKSGVVASMDEVSEVSVVSELSDEVRYRFNLALFYQEEKNFPQAKREYEKVVQMWPLYAEAHNNLAVVYKELGLHDQGIDHLKKALSLNSDYTRAYHNLGAIYQLKGDLKRAKKYYQKALSVDRNYLSSYNNLGLVYRDEKRLHKAREILEKALAINPSFSQTNYNLALVLEELGELEQSRFHYRKFVDLAGEENRSLVERVEDHLREIEAGL
ncbi:MAG: tetratricopeptide repeat protein [Deltaproteobacteria bacterium]|nr:tetratricopeptide repeat protein [Deltaproteobacteria bacterium]